MVEMFDNNSGNTVCQGFTSILVRKITKEDKAGQQQAPHSALKQKNGTNCVSGVRKLRVGLEPKSKLSDAQGLRLFSQKNTGFTCVWPLSLAQEQQEGNTIYQLP